MEEVGSERNVSHARDGPGLAVVERLEFASSSACSRIVTDKTDEFAAFAGRQAGHGPIRRRGEQR
jgi:hypothetical protein